MTLLEDLPDDMADVLKQSLKKWADSGSHNAVIPAYTDVDGDGKPDFFALDSFGELELVSSENVKAQQESETTPAWVRT